MEFNFYFAQEQESRFHIFDFEDFAEDDRFLDWMMEFEDAQFDSAMDNYLCMKMQSKYRPISKEVADYLNSMKWADSEARSWKLSPTKEADYERMFIEIYYSTGDSQYSGYNPKSVEGYLAMTSIDDRRALYSSLGIKKYLQYGNPDCFDINDLQGGSFPDQDSHAFDHVLPLVDDCQAQGYSNFNYFNEGSDDWDTSESQRLFDDSFCPEQAIVREIPLRGLKHSARKALIREYCVA